MEGLAITPARIVEASEVGKRFGNRWALRDLNLRINSGEITSLVGANGGGKTTTLRILAGLLKPDEGNCVFWEDQRSILAAEFRPHIGYLTQSDSLYQNLTVQENLQARCWLYGLSQSKHIINQAIRKFELEFYRNQRLSTLSGGWKRRAQFAAITLHQPKLLLLDEPTAGLDAEARRAIWQSVLALAGSGTAIVTSTHDLEEVGLSQTLAVYRAGHKVEVGSPSDLVARYPISVLRVVVGQTKLGQLLQNASKKIGLHPWGGQLRLVSSNEESELLQALAGEQEVELLPETPNLTDLLVWLSAQGNGGSKTMCASQLGAATGRGGL